MLLRVPLPTGTSKFVARASGPTIVATTQEVHTSVFTKRSSILSDALNGTRNFLPEHSYRHLELMLPMLGVYAVEVLRIYSSFEPNDHDNLAVQCPMPHVALSARIAVARQSLDPLLPSLSDSMRWIARSPASESPELPTRIQRSMDEKESLARHRAFQWARCSRSGGCAAAECPSCALRRSCLAGDSHARNLCASLPRCTFIKLQFADASPSADATALQGVGNNTVFDMARMSEHNSDRYSNPAPFDEIARSCAGVDLFVHLGQWDFGWPGGLTPFPYFHHSLHGLLERLRFLRLGLAHGGDARLPGNRMFLLTSNYNPLDARMLACPPTEWRTPPIIDEANRIIAAVGARLGLPGKRYRVCPLTRVCPQSRLPTMWPTLRAHIAMPLFLSSHSD